MFMNTIAIAKISWAEHIVKKYINKYIIFFMQNLKIMQINLKEILKKF